MQIDANANYLANLNSFYKNFITSFTNYSYNTDIFVSIFTLIINSHVNPM